MDKLLSFNQYRIIEESGKTYLYVPQYNGIFQTDTNLVNLLQQEGNTYEDAYENMENYYSKEKFDESIALLNKFFILKNDNTIIEGTTNSDSELSSIVLFLSQECNLRCIYCYADGGEYNDRGRMSLDTAKEAIIFAIKNVKKNHLDICFFGGEPLLCFELLKDIVSFTKNENRKYNKVITYSMTTNGTLINNEVEEFILKNDIDTMISIDGNEYTQNINRPFENNKGSYKQVIDKTKSLREIQKLSARVTISNNNFNVYENHQHLDELGFINIATTPAFNLLNQDNYTSLVSEVKKMIIEFEKFIKNKNFAIAKKMHIPYRLIRRLSNARINDYACGVARNTYAVDIHGDIYPCHRFVNNKEYKIGDVYNGFTEQRIKFINSTKISKCRDCESCWCRNICLGGCPHENVSANNDINVPNKIFCIYSKAIIEEVMHVYIRLTNEEKNELLVKKQV